MRKVLLFCIVLQQALDLALLVRCRVKYRVVFLLQLPLLRVSHPNYRLRDGSAVRVVAFEFKGLVGVDPELSDGEIEAHDSLSGGAVTESSVPQLNEES